MKSTRITEQDLGTLYNAGSWFMFSKTLIKVVDLEHAAFLSYLLNRPKGEEGWVFVPVKLISEDLGLSDNQQRRILENLTNKNIIEQTKRGVPARRHIKIDVVALHKMIAEEPEATKPKKKAKKQFVFGEQTTKIDAFDKKCASYFVEDILHAHGRVKTVNMKKYAEQFRLLRQWDLKKNTKAKQLIKEVLQFYAKNYRNPYIPRAVSAKAFRDKFDDIYDFMLRKDEQEEQKTTNEIEVQTV